MCSSLVQHFTCPRTTARSRSCPDPWSFPRLLSIDPATRVKISSILHHGALPFFATLHCTGCWTDGMACHHYNHISSFNVYFQRSFWSLSAHDILILPIFLIFALILPQILILKTMKHVPKMHIIPCPGCPPRTGVSISKQVGIISPVSSWALQIIAGREGGGGQGWRQGAAQLFRTLATG